jgi:hypothetical protein
MEVLEFTVEATHYKLKCSKCSKQYTSSSKFDVLKWMTHHLSVMHGCAIPLDERGALITHTRRSPEALMEAHLKGVK